MLIKQITEFELRVTPSRICIFATGYFYDKTKISAEDLQMNYYLLLKYCRRECPLFSPIWAKSLTKFNLNCKILKMFWT